MLLSTRLEVFYQLYTVLMVRYTCCITFFLCDNIFAVICQYLYSRENSGDLFVRLLVFGMLAVLKFSCYQTNFHSACTRNRTEIQHYYCSEISFFNFPFQFISTMLKFASLIRNCWLWRRKWG
jgi:hypothetical protein